MQPGAEYKLLATNTLDSGHWASLVGVDGAYHFAVDAPGVVGTNGNAGVGQASVDWTRDTVQPGIEPIPPIVTNPRNTVVPSVEVTFTDALRQHLAKKGFDPLMGARPMQRLIQDTIRRALADELLFGRLVDGGRLTVDIDAEGQPVLDIQPARKDGKASKAEPATTD